MHAMGRLPSLHEHHVIESILAESAEDDYLLADLIVSLCESKPFIGKAPTVNVASVN